MASLLITSSRDFRPRLRTFIISSSVLEIRSSTVLMLALLEAVEASHRQVQLLDGHLQHLVPLRLRLLHHRGLAAHVLREIREEGKVVTENLCAQRYRIPGRDGAIRPDL